MFHYILTSAWRMAPSSVVVFDLNVAFWLWLMCVCVCVCECLCVCVCVWVPTRVCLCPSREFVFVPVCKHRINSSINRLTCLIGDIKWKHFFVIVYLALIFPSCAETTVALASDSLDPVLATTQTTGAGCSPSCPEWTGGKGLYFKDSRGTWHPISARPYIRKQLKPRGERTWAVIRHISDGCTVLIDRAPY